jgi:hypothetical protein
MTTAISALRTTLAEALSNPEVWSVFAFPPTTPQANSVIIQPDDPYISPTNQQWNSISPMAHFIVSMIVPAFDNQGNLQGIENFMVQVFNKLSTAGIQIQVGDISGVKVLGVDAGQMLSADMQIGVLTSWE